MMEWLRAVGIWGLVVGIELGIPVAMLFGVGYSLYRRRPRQQLEHSRSQAPYQGSKPGSAERAAAAPLHCWEMRACPAEVKEGCPAFHQPDMPCWKAVKQASGDCIQARCFECSLLLSWQQSPRAVPHQGRP